MFIVVWKGFEKKKNFDVLLIKFINDRDVGKVLKILFFIFKEYCC